MEKLTVNHITAEVLKNHKMVDIFANFQNGHKNEMYFDGPISSADRELIQKSVEGKWRIGTWRNGIRVFKDGAPQLAVSYTF